jgi:hypothetical protein
VVEAKLLELAARELGRPLRPEAARAVREAAADHALEEAAGWLAPLLDRLLAGTPTAGPVEVPAGYPGGAGGLANVWADLAGEPWVDVDDYGEGATWRLPRAGLEVFLCREHRAGVCTYEVRRAAAEPGAAADRAGGSGLRGS